MQVDNVPRCPKCMDGGNVKQLVIQNVASGVFKPLPEGWQETIAVFQCECGWTRPVAESESLADSH